MRIVNDRLAWVCRSACVRCKVAAAVCVRYRAASGTMAARGDRAARRWGRLKQVRSCFTWTVGIRCVRIYRRHFSGAFMEKVNLVRESGAQKFQKLQAHRITTEAFRKPVSPAAASGATRPTFDRTISWALNPVVLTVPGKERLVIAR